MRIGRIRLILGYHASKYNCFKKCASCAANKTSTHAHATAIHSADYAEKRNEAYKREGNLEDINYCTAGKKCNERANKFNKTVTDIYLGNAMN